MQTWSLPDRHPGTPGPWSDEPDRVQWIDEDTGLDCLMVRNGHGAWCGYVGVGPEHPCHGSGYDDVDVEVHGGLTYADACQEGAPEEQLELICHIPEPGREAHVWWLGFDCGHFMDRMPLMEERHRSLGLTTPHLDDLRQVYRDMAYVQQECRHLAAQLAAMR